MNKRLPNDTTLLSREEFKIVVFRRSSGRCVFCGKPAVDPHHILERKLFGDGGYYLGNGAAVCEDHHWGCETTRITLEQVRSAALVRSVVLPPGFRVDADYDKWGNRCWPSGLRSWGPLEQDTGARKALAAGGHLGLMMPSNYVEEDFVLRADSEQSADGPRRPKYSRSES